MTALLETNLIKQKNGQFAKYLHSDFLGRKIFIFNSGTKAVLLDDQEFYSITKEYGEPDCPIKKELQPTNINIYRFEDQKIPLYEWEDYFEPVNDEDMGEKRFYSYKDACSFASSRYCREPYQHIWSIVEGDSGKLILLNGRHKCNVLDYIVCDTPWGLGEDSDSAVYLEVDYNGEN